MGISILFVSINSFWIFFCFFRMDVVVITPGKAVSCPTCSVKRVEAPERPLLEISLKVKRYVYVFLLLSLEPIICVLDLHVLCIGFLKLILRSQKK